MVRTSRELTTTGEESHSPATRTTAVQQERVCLVATPAQNVLLRCRTRSGYMPGHPSNAGAYKLYCNGKPQTPILIFQTPVSLRYHFQGHDFTEQQPQQQTVLVSGTPKTHPGPTQTYKPLQQSRKQPETLHFNSSMPTSELWALGVGLLGIIHDLTDFYGSLKGSIDCWTGF